jgi:6-phosphogluconolactonase
MTEVFSFDFDAELTAQAAIDIAELIQQAISERGVARLALTGGTLGIQILADLARQGIDLEKIDIFFGDERFVALDHADRNEHQGLIAWPELATSRLHRFPAPELDLAQAADVFNSAITEMFGPLGSETAVFDVVILGMGPDGHVASLFPGHEHERRWIIAEKDSPKPPSQRLTFSYEALNRARAVMFLASGSAKAKVAKCAIEDSACDLPAAKVKGTEITRWYVDQEISREL